jgi:hypothetical protein
MKRIMNINITIQAVWLSARSASRLGLVCAAVAGILDLKIQILECRDREQVVV